MTPSQILLTIKACILLGLLSLAYYLGGASARVDLAQYKTKVVASTAKAADLATKAERIARRTEQAHALALSQVADQYEKDKLNDQAAHARDVAGLNSDKLRLRAHWQGCKATAELSGNAASAALADAAEQLRRADTATLIGIGREADTKERGLQQVIRADRR